MADDTRTGWKVRQDRARQKYGKRDDERAEIAAARTKHAREQAAREPKDKPVSKPVAKGKDD
jgi:hypothetical protein